LDRHDAGDLRRVAHTVKGALGQFGAEAACAAAQRLEAMGQDGNLAGAAEACAVLEQELRRVEPALVDFSHSAG
jgi:HPt (histidine-containing phosphotransfer) domain-containing protein